MSFYTPYNFNKAGENFLTLRSRRITANSSAAFSLLKQAQRKKEVEKIILIFSLPSTLVSAAERRRFAAKKSKKIKSQRAKTTKIAQNAGFPSGILRRC